MIKVDNDLLKKLCNISLDELINLIVMINQEREDIYIECIDELDYDRNTIQTCKESDVSLISQDRIEDIKYLSEEDNCSYEEEAFDDNAEEEEDEYEN